MGRWLARPWHPRRVLREQVKRARLSLRSRGLTLLEQPLSLSWRAPRCARCGKRLDPSGSCQACDWARRLSAPQWIELVADHRSFRPFGTSRTADPLRFEGEVAYREQVERARAETGLDESVVAGRARIDGHDVVLVVFDFRFLGGSVGVATGEKIVEAISAAELSRDPVVMIVSSSGARMQEGLPALMQMARTSAAVVSLHEARVPFIAVLADPTTGAAYASCVNLADVLLAEEGALIGFAGPRVVATVTGAAPQPARAEALAEAGIVDVALPRGEIRGALAEVLALVDARRSALRAERAVLLPAPRPATARWDLVQTVRKPEWPSGPEWLDALADRLFLLAGDRTGVDDPALVCALLEVGGIPMLGVAQNRHAGGGTMQAAGYRKALRAFRIAARLDLPVLSLVDSAGAAVGPDADEGGIAYWIAECFAALLELPVPVVAVVVGQGSSGGGLALAVADRVYMLERSTFSVLSPEGAAAILARDSRPGPDWADALKIAAADAFELGLVDGVLPEPRALRPRSARFRQVRELLPRVLTELATLEPDALVAARRRRYLESTRHLLRSDAPLREAAQASRLDSRVSRASVRRLSSEPGLGGGSEIGGRPA